MLEMNYSPENKRELLAKGFYLGYKYFILNLGRFPTAYIEIPETHKYYKKDYYDINDINCHGGLTYSKQYLWIAENKKIHGWFIGWDYGHAGDYCCFKNMNIYELDGKKWTTPEILEEVKNVCRQLLKKEE